MEFVPRAPGLWMATHDDDDNKSPVDEATKHLLQLLADPFYQEAYQRLRMADHELVRVRSMRSSEVGSWSRKIQYPKPLRSRGRPAEAYALENFLIDHYCLEKINTREKSLKQFSVWFVGIFGKEVASDHWRKARADKLYQSLKNAIAKRRRVGKK